MDKDNHSIDNAFEILLEQAVKNAGEEISESYPVPEEHEFSVEFENNMNRLFRKERNKLRIKNLISHSKRVAMIFLVIAIASGITVFSVDAWRYKIINLWYEITEKDTEVKFHEENNIDETVETSGNLVLRYIPDGFELIREDIEGDGKLITLIFQKNDMTLMVSKKPLDGISYIDTEGAEVKTLTINGYDAIYSTKPRVNILVWNDGENVYTASATLGDDEVLSEEELIKIAENHSYF